MSMTNTTQIINRHIARTMSELERGDWLGPYRDAVKHGFKWLRDDLQALESDATPCTWTEDDEGNWATACDNLHVFFEGGPSENGYKWCPYCGRAVASERGDERNERNGHGNG